MKNADQPINPCVMQKTGPGESDYCLSKDKDPREYLHPVHGLTKREYFAIMIAQGMCSRGPLNQGEPFDIPAAIKAADNLLEKLEEAK